MKIVKKCTALCAAIVSITAHAEPELMTQLLVMEFDAAPVKSISSGWLLEEGMARMHVTSAMVSEGMKACDAAVVLALAKLPADWTINSVVAVPAWNELPRPVCESRSLPGGGGAGPGFLAVQLSQSGNPLLGRVKRNLRETIIWNGFRPSAGAHFFRCEIQV